MVDEPNAEGTTRGGGVARGQVPSASSWRSFLPSKGVNEARAERDRARSERDAARRALKSARSERDAALLSLTSAQEERDATREELARERTEGERARVEQNTRLLQNSDATINEVRALHVIALATDQRVRKLDGDLASGAAVRDAAQSRERRSSPGLRTGSGTRFASTPFVCGAIGNWDERVLARLTRDAPVAVTPVLPIAKGVPLALFSSGETAIWRSSGSIGHCWGALAYGSAPRGWSDASERWMATGAVNSDAEVAVHTDALGFQDLYYRRLGNAVYFSVRIAPLLDLDSAKLHINWSAWASTLAVTSPVGEDTPFTEIRRMPAASAWVCRGEKLALESFEPSWMAVEPDPRLSAEAIVDVLQDSIRTERNARITLSGGWDSRMLGILASKRIGTVTAYTTSHDDGYELDMEFAPPVAEALGMEHRQVLPDDNAWLREYSSVRRRTEFQTVHHTWFMPLYRQLHHGGTPVLDGLAGDVLFKNLFVTPELLSEQDPDKRWQAVWDSLGGRSLRRDALLRPAVLDSLMSASRDALRTATTATAGHPAAATLSILHTRTARAIASSPLLLLAPEATVELPFANADVVTHALRVPLDAKVDGRFYLQMLEAADPQVSALPSTNTVKPRGPRGPRRLMMQDSLNALVGHIRESELVMSLLRSETRQSILDTPIDTNRYRTLAWASIFGQWLEEHEAHLVMNEIH